MGILYHGSHIHDLKFIEPHKSTHGEYVYATNTKEMAILFSKKCGDDLVYTLSRDDVNKPFDLVERIPDAFNYMYTTDASIYTLDDITFKNVNSNFSSNEVVSDKKVRVLNEEYLPNLIDELDKLEINGFIKIYRYPSKPEYIPQNDADLLERELNHLKKIDHEISKKSLARLVYLHPNLLERVNEILYEMDQDTIDDEDLVKIYDYYLNRTDKETYAKSSYKLLYKYYPNLAENINIDNKVIK